MEPQNRPPVVQVPVHHREPEDMHPRRGQRVPIRDLEYQDEQNSPPPIAPYRQHHRRARTLSPTSRYEERKRAQREAERVEHEQRQRERWRLDQDAECQRRYQAQRDAEQEGRRVQREAEEIEIRRQERARREAEGLASRRRDQARREAAERERRRQDRVRREAEEQERRRQDRARRDEQRRNERRRAAGIPQGPRHLPAVHQYTRGRGSLDDRGAQVLNEAIQARTEAERNDPYRGWYPWPDTGGLRRRDTVAGGQRWVTEHDRRRGGRRHWI
ncbi:hypothetical protein MMC22_006909 [Lobaria immixta]|nr:hypothetical protein [Lobaria immixta]